MKKTFLRIGSACGLALLFFGSSSVHAFCTEFEVADVALNCGGEGHILVTRAIQPLLRQDIWAAIWDGNYAQDSPFGDARNDGQRHFESCRFGTDGAKGGSTDYIRNVYRLGIASLDPANPDPFTAADRFGKLLHTVQDFYSHTNWINLLNITASTPLNSTHLFDRSLGEWPLLRPLSSVRYDDVADCHPDDIVVGQIPAGGLTAGWSVAQEFTSETPFFTTDQGCRLPGLITGWNENGACPDVRDDATIDEYSHLSQGLLIPRTLRLTHGESKIAGQTDLISELSASFVDAGYQAERPCHDGYPTYICLQKDTPGRPDYGRAIQLAEYQTAHEWCRLLHLAKDSQFGYAASSILMTLWAKPEDEPFGPHPITTACGTPRAVLAGKPGPIELEVTPTAASISRGEVFPNSGRNLVFALYTGDFRRSLYSVPDPLAQVAGPVGAADLPAPITMCVNPGDTVVATIWGWDDVNIQVVGSPFSPREFDSQEPPLRGVSTVLAGPGFAPGTHSESSADMAVDFAVRVNPTDVDADGLAICAEQFYDTNPLDPDTDHDGLSDGTETFGTNPTDPLVADSDRDGLKDGQEDTNKNGSFDAGETNPNDSDTDDDLVDDGVEVNGRNPTNPVDPDSDDDGLLDGQEDANRNGELDADETNPNDADSDDDWLSDGQELDVGTNPLNPDTDGDGLLDGRDVDWIEDAILAIPGGAIKSPAAGNRNAMLNLLADAEAHLLRGKIKPALDKLTTLRSRIDGCGSDSDSNDWITDCAEQVRIRQLLDILIANL